MYSPKLQEYEQLQSSASLIVKGAFEEIERLNAENEALKKRTQHYNTELEALMRRLELSICLRCHLSVLNQEKPITVNDVKQQLIDDEILKEVEELSSLELDSQFHADEESPFVVIETPSPDQKITNAPRPMPPPRLQTTTKILEEMFGCVTQPNPISAGDGDILVAESPERPPHPANRVPFAFIPETLPQDINETTPQKCDPTGARWNPATKRRNLLLANGVAGDPLNNGVASSPKSPVVRLTPIKELMPAKKDARLVSQLISPSRPQREPSDKLVSTPKRAKVSPRKMKSPRTFRTPGQKPLKKSHIIQAEISHLGVRKLTQTQLNVACFKAPNSQENKDVGAVRHRRERSPKPSSPLNSLENSPDLDETNLTPSAVRRIASDVKIEEYNEELISSYDRIPARAPAGEETKREARKRLPAVSCPDCDRFFNYFGNGDEDVLKNMINRCSRHRLKEPPPQATPVGFWVPVVSQTPSP